MESLRRKVKMKDWLKNLDSLKQMEIEMHSMKDLERLRHLGLEMEMLILKSLGMQTMKG